ncbi:MAG TPA: glycosyltransferase [Candidatus Kapabacteria bacterium]|nr:glycosyltransferase [Candidatus Kapabacteria bacterium]
MILLLLCVAILYWIRSLVFYIGARRAAHPGRVQGNEPKISVVVAARNEEKNIGQCLRTLVGQEYPADKMEIIVMDDGSTDATGTIISTLISSYPSVKLFHVQKEDSHLRGKSRAVAQGFDHASGEIFVTTDADCVVPPLWLKQVASYFDAKTGVVAGFTLQKYSSVFEAVQSLDWAYILTLASSGMGLRKPLGCIGNNLAFRREAYESVGGYRKIPFSITEDLALLQAVCNTGKWDYKYPLDADMLVWSEPCPSMRSLWSQKCRWALGGKKLGLRGYVVLIVSVLMDLGLLVSLATMQWDGLLLLFAARWIADIIILMPTLRALRCGKLYKYFIPYEFYALIYEILLPIGLMKKEIEWKGRTF